MTVTERDLNSIRPYENNPRQNDAAVEYVANSIRAFGWKQPIVIDRDGVIVAGHTRWKAAQKLGMETVPCVVADDLTPEQVKAYRLADNKVAELAEWDFKALEFELTDLAMDFDMSEFGFLDEEEEPEAEEDDFEPEPPEEPKARRGDIYQLGRHRLMCGDATDAGDVGNLMGGQKADIAITSPPYGVARSARLRDHYDPNGTKKTESFYNEHEDDPNQWMELVEKALVNMAGASSAQFVNIQMLADNKRDLFRIIANHIERLCDVIIWDKEHGPPQMQDCVLTNEFEFVFVFAEPGASRVIPFSDFHGNKGNVIRLKTGANEFSDIHKAVFPVELPAQIMKISNKAETVLDLFGGTGTTLLACEQLNRSCFMMELDPKYVDVIINRWETFTGEKAVLVGNG